MSNQILNDILLLFLNSNKPYTTNEIVKLFNKPRHIIKNRLDKLAIEGKIKGKQTKNRGSWIWWMPPKETNNKSDKTNEIKDLKKKVKNLQENNLKIQNELSKKKFGVNNEEIKKLREENGELNSDIELFIDFVNKIVSEVYKHRSFESENEKYNFFGQEYDISSYLIKKYFTD